MQKILIPALLALCSSAAFAQTSSLLVYKVWERGIDPYVSRIFVTPEHVRLDEGGDENGYTLFDRQLEIVYNVIPDDRTIFVINPGAAAVKENPALLLDAEVTIDEEAPSVVGRQPQNVRLLANGETCKELVVIDGVMEDALEGLAELKLVLARVQAGLSGSTPLDGGSACELADNIYAPDRVLSHGLPLQERGANRSQSLVDFSDSFEVEDSLFELPADYARRPMFAPAAI